MIMTSVLGGTNNNLGSNLGYYQWKHEWQKKKKIKSTKSFNLTLSNFIDGVKQILTSKEPIEQFSFFIFNQGLQIRMEAFKYLSPSEKQSSKESFEKATNFVKEIKTNNRLEILAENILFALRCNKKVIEGFSKGIETPNVSLLNSLLRM